MSSPFFYTAPLYDLTPYMTPFIKQVPALPFLSPRTLAPDQGTPASFRRVRFDNEDMPPLVPRPRPDSWHASTASPFVMTPLQPYATLPPAGPAQSGDYQLQAFPAYALGHHRSHSFSAVGAAPTYTQPPWYILTPMMQPIMQAVQLSPMVLHTPELMQIHPFLDGTAPRPDFVFDLSAPTFNPVHIRANGESTPISIADMDQPATQPPVFNMRITCDMIPQWPIDLELSRSPRSVLLQVPSPSGAMMVPITVHDVLQSVYQHLRAQISHLDWAQLSYSEEAAISRAFTRRCRASGHGNVLGEQSEAAQGVKRIDYLMDRFMFRGLVSAGSYAGGFENVKLIVGAR